MNVNLNKTSSSSTQYLMNSCPYESHPPPLCPYNSHPPSKFPYESHPPPFPQQLEASYKSSTEYNLPDLSIPPPPITNPPPIISIPPPPQPLGVPNASWAPPVCSYPPNHFLNEATQYNYSNNVHNAQFSMVSPSYSNPPPPFYPTTSPSSYQPCKDLSSKSIAGIPREENRAISHESSNRYDWSERRRNRSDTPHKREAYSSYSYKERYTSPEKDYRKTSRSSSYRESFQNDSYGSREASQFKYSKHKRSCSPEDRCKTVKHSQSRRRSKERSPMRRLSARVSPPSRRSTRSPTSRQKRSRSSRSPRLSPPPPSKYRSRSPVRNNSYSKTTTSSSQSKEKIQLRLTKRESLVTHRTDTFSSGEDSDKESDVGSDNICKSQFEEVKASWVRSAPADLFYSRDESNPLVMKATSKLVNLCNAFEEMLIKKAQKLREKNEAERKNADNACKKSPNNAGPKVGNSTSKPNHQKDSANEESSSADADKEKTPKCDGETTPGTSEAPGCGAPHCDKNGDGKRKKRAEARGKKRRKERNGCASNCSSSSSDSGSEGGGCSSSSSSSSSSSEDEDEWASKGAEEMERKRNHPDRLHSELWFNDPGEMNDGPLCRCSIKARRSGIRHGYYAGEESLTSCDPLSNNANKLYHYLVTISPPTNFLVKTPTTITHDNHELIFEGFSLLSHHPLVEVPTCQVIRFNIEYSIFYVKDKMPENFCIRELDLFYEYLFTEILELVDLNFKAIGNENGCPRFHFMPRFVRQLPDNGKEVLSMNEVLRYLMKSYIPLVLKEDLVKLVHFSEHEWLNYTDQVKGMIVTCPGKKPCSIRVDQLDRDQTNDEALHYPVIVHFGIRPPQLSYAGNPEYQKALREYVKFRHLLANMPKPSFEDKRQLEIKENRLQEMRMGSKMKRDVTVAISADGFFRTGIMCDIVQHALLIPVLVRHLRFHQSLATLEEKINYKFKTRYLLQLALTHPSYRENFGTNPDHARNALTNCGVRQPQYGDRRIHFMTTHKRGINTLVNIMSRFGKNEESESKITHNERLEFLGDAVIEFLTSIHLFHLFPTLEEGGLATYRAAVVQNQHLSVLADKLSLDQFVLHAHGSDLCHTVELRHAMANCFEALMGAIFLDTNIEAADAVFSATLFKDEDELHDIWVNYNRHPLQEQEPQGDRRWIETFPILQKLTKFEESIGVEFTHIRLLARAFMDRSVEFNYLTLGSNQRLEFLGDTVLQLITSERLYRFFPEHHEGHLSLLRSSLVNNRTQAVVCDDLQLTKYAMYSNLKTELKTKDRADLLEAFLGALYIDRGLHYCRVFSLVCFFPRLQQFIINQEWNDPKSKLQQCCLTLRTMEGGEPDIPVYKVIECKGPTNTRVYTVAVYFKNKRLAKASGHSIQQAEMNAAKEALLTNKKLFPQLAYQRRVIEKNIKIQGVSPPQETASSAEGSSRQDKDETSRKSPSRRRPSPGRRDESSRRHFGRSASDRSSNGERRERDRGREKRKSYRREEYSRRRSPLKKTYETKDDKKRNVTEKAKTSSSNVGDCEVENSLPSKSSL